MDNELPIFIMPSRAKWGMLTFMMASGFVLGVVLLILGWMPWDTDWEKFGFYLLVAVAGLIVPFVGWNCTVAPPRVIVDEYGVGGRFIGGGYIGVKRIAWDDITGARFCEMQHFPSFSCGTVRKVLCLEVNNDNGKYLRVRKLGAMLEKYIPIKNNFAFSFDITFSEIDKKQAEEIVAVINSRAKGKPPEGAKESGKSPFATDE